MGVSGGPYIVRDSSLVLELDAADRNSYVSGSLIWNDLSENRYSASLINSPTFNSGSFGNIVLDGTNEYANLGFNPIYNLYSSDLTNQKWTIEVWHNLSFKGNSQFLIGPYGGSIEFGIFLEFSTSNKGLMWTEGGKFLYSNGPLTGIGNTHVAMVFDGSSTQRSQYIYKNGVLENSRTDVVVDTYPSLNTNMYIAGDGSSGGSNGSIYNFRIYRKALSATEVLQNYNAQKSRFGLK
jgi:hypothetical protein